MSEPDEREWGAWSVWKTVVLLGGYLRLFGRATKRATHRTFIDCFAGVATNRYRATGEIVPSSPVLALDTDPPFTHVLLFEQPAKAAGLEAMLKERYPGRELKVVGGDCNAKIRDGLTWVRSHGGATEGPHLGPTLAYLDPDHLELNWTTVQTLAQFAYDKDRKPGEPYTRKNRIELLILFPTGPMRRQMPPDKGLHPNTEERLTRLFGCDEWRPIWDDHRVGVILGEDAWLHYVDLYRRRLEQMGYEHTAAIEVRNTRRVVLYHMVFATTSNAGRDVMTSVMSRARELLPEMLREDRRRKDDRLSLFDEETIRELERDPAQFARLFGEPPVPYVPGHPVPVEETLVERKQKDDQLRLL